MRLLVLGAMAALTMAMPARAEQWREVAESDSAPKTLMFIDQASVKRTGHTATAWVMTVLDYDPTGERDWNQSIIYRQVDCNVAQSQMMHSKFYMDGKLLEDSDTPGDWIKINSGSMVEGVADVMCGRAEYGTDVISDPMGYSKAYFTQ